MEKHLLVVGLEPFKKGQIIDKEDKPWPLHITVLSWFRLPEIDRLQAELKSLADKTKPINIKLGRMAMYGIDNDVRVLELQHNDEFIKLHRASLKLVHHLGGNVIDNSFIGDSYSPHVTIKHNSPAYHEYEIEQLALTADLGDQKRVIEEVFSFNAAAA